MSYAVVILESQSVSVYASGSAAEVVARYVCDSLNMASLATEPDSAAAALGVDSTHDAIALLRHGSIVGSTVDRGVAAEWLMRELVRELVSPYSEGLALHCGAVRTEHGIILIPAVSGGGKSTLVTYLGRNGFSFCTDELAFVSGFTLRAHALARPAHLKSGSVFLRTQLSLEDAGLLPCDDGLLISAKSLGCREPPPPLPVRAIVFPTYDSTRPTTTLTKLRSGEGAFHLARSLVNARNLDQGGMPLLARLCGAAPCYALNLGPLERALAEVRRVAS